MSRDNESVALRAKMVQEIHRRYPQLSDTAISRLTGISRDMVRRHRLGLTKAALVPPAVLKGVKEIVGMFTDLQPAPANSVDHPPK